VDGDGHVLGSVAERGVDELAVLLGERVEVLAPAGGGLAHVEIAEVLCGDEHGNSA
jgi:hypothetical protein